MADSEYSTMDKPSEVALPHPPALPPREATAIIASNSNNRPLPSLPPTTTTTNSQLELRPPLPPREGRRRHVLHTPTHQKRSSTFGLDRVEGEEYEADSPTKSEVKPLDLLKEEPKPNFQEILLRYLIDIREAQVAHAINEGIASNYVLPTDTYLTEINSKDVYTDILGEINSGIYDNADNLSLYQLLLNAFSIVEKLDVEPHTDSEVLLDREALTEIVGELMLNKDMVPDFRLITSITKVRTPNPLVVHIQDKYDSIRLSIVLTILFDRFVVNNDHFMFLLVRVLERLDPAKLLLLYKDKNGDVLSYLKELFNSSKFWCNLLITLQSKDLLDKFIHQTIVYGVESMIDTLVTFQFFPDKLDAIAIASNLIEFDKAYSFITNREPEPSSGDELNKENYKMIRLQQDLATKSSKYNDLLNNYKQLNEEKYNDETILKKLKITNKELETSRSSYEQKLNTLLANFEVIKINNDKNLEISSINDDLREEIEKLAKDVNDMKKKLKKK